MFTYRRPSAGSGGLSSGEILPGRKISTHTLWHNYAHCLLTNDIHINYLNRRLTHIYLNLPGLGRES